MLGRVTNSDSYRFGYNGMEVDPEMKGQGNSYTTEFRQYDPRLGRWASLDPLMAKYSWMSPYVAFDNNPIVYTDPLGLSTSGDPIIMQGSHTNSQPRENKVMQASIRAKNGDVLVFQYTQKGDNAKILYVYTYNSESGKWSVSMEHHSVNGHGVRSQKLADFDPNPPTPKEEKMNAISNAVQNTSSGSTMLKETIKSEQGITEKATTYKTKDGSIRNDYYRNVNGKDKPLYNSRGNLNKSGTMTKAYKSIKVIDNYLGKISTVSDYRDLGYHVVKGNWGAATEKLVIMGADKIADRLLMTPTPATVAIGIAIKGALFIYENWDSFKAAYKWLSSPSPPFKSVYFPKPPGGIYQDNLEKQDVVPSSILNGGNSDFNPKPYKFIKR